MAKKKTKKKVGSKRASTRKKTAPPEQKVMGFRAGSQAARMYGLLSDGKARSVTEVHKVLDDASERHIANGLLWLLRKRGAETGKFHIVRTADSKLQLRKGPKPDENVARASKSVDRRHRKPESEQTGSEGKHEGSES